MNIGIIGLGYVGLPLALEFSKIHQVVGFDIDSSRVEDLRRCFDSTLEATEDELRATKAHFTVDKTALEACSIYIVTVPTPVDSSHRPDLQPLINASELVGKVLKRGDIVIFESTVYPGCTEEDCVPVLERFSGLKFNADFFCGYSPERINPGDKTRKFTTIKKVTSGSTPEVAQIVDDLYRQVVTAGTYKAPTIKVAEAAKVLENTQRDVNIALMNEIAIIFNLLNVDTESVLRAAESKWNFISFRPGLVGGHCIGIDPYYLKFKSQALGFHPEIISSVRRLNDGMPKYVAAQFVKGMAKKGISLVRASILIMGLTFKENCPDIRNSKTIDVIRELGEYGFGIDVFDPWVNSIEMVEDFGAKGVRNIADNRYDGIIITVSHDVFKEMGPKAVRNFGKSNVFIYDLKYIFGLDSSDKRL